MEKLFYSIGEVAEILGESTSLVRFWSNSFPAFIKPDRNAKGNTMNLTADPMFSCSLRMVTSNAKVLNLFLPPLLSPQNCGL